MKKLRDQAKLTLAALAWPMRGTRSIFGGGGGGGRPQEKMGEGSKKWHLIRTQEARSQVIHSLPREGHEFP